MSELAAGECILFSRGVNKSCDDDREGDGAEGIPCFTHTHTNTAVGREGVFYESGEQQAAV